MTSFLRTWEKTEPFFVNEKGVTFWLDTNLTDYAKQKDSNNVSLDNVVVYVLKETDGQFWYMIAKTSGEAIFTSKSLEEIGVRLDVMKTARHYAKKDLEKAIQKSRRKLGDKHKRASRSCRRNHSKRTPGKKTPA